jgi:hypothetical protein
MIMHEVVIKDLCYEILGNKIENKSKTMNDLCV